MYLEKYMKLLEKAIDIDTSDPENAFMTECIIDSGLSFINYYSAKIEQKMKCSPAYIFASNLEGEALREHIKHYDTLRRSAHTPALQSFFILNRFATMQNLEAFYDGPILDPKNIEDSGPERDAMTATIKTFLSELNSSENERLKPLMTKYKSLNLFEEIPENEKNHTPSNDEDIIRKFRNYDEI